MRLLRQLLTRARRVSLVVWMLLAIAVVTVFAWWDQEKESASALEAFAREQATLAQGLSVGVAVSQARANGTDEAEREGQPAGIAHVLATLRSIERPGTFRVLLRPPTTSTLLATNGTTLASETIANGLEQGKPWVRLTREEAAALGLNRRTAIAGLRTLGLTLDSSVTPSTASRPWGIAVVVSAEEQRDREVRATRRLLLWVFVTVGLVIAFGGLALRNQRKELELSHALTIFELEQQRDDRLVRADKLATMGALASGVAHEISTPLAVILGRAEQLMPKQKDDRARRAAEVIVEQAERIGVIVRGFLSLARGETPMLQQVDPMQLAQTAVDLVRHRFTKASVEIRLRTKRAGDASGHALPLTPPMASLSRIACEPRLMEQVLVNLLLNACDACGRGGIVELTVEEDLAAGRLRFVLVDDGVGISSVDAARAVQPFFTTKPAGQGTGLGLAIANEIVKHHGGTLSLTPRARGEGRGTIARVELTLTGSGATVATMTKTEERALAPTTARSVVSHG